MVWKTSLILALLLSGCAASLRRINICGPLDVTNDKTDCARSDKEFTKKVTELGGWKSMSPLSTQIVAQKLAECDTNGKIPNGRTLDDIEVCVVNFPSHTADCALGDVVPTRISTEHIDGWYATDALGFEMIRSKLNFCGEHN